MIESMETFSYNIDIIYFLHKKGGSSYGERYCTGKNKKGGITAVVGGAVLMLIFGLITIGVMSDNADDGMGMIILFGLFALLGIVFIIIGIRNIVRPEKTGYLKNNPQLLEMADQLYSHIIYEDQYVLISDKVLANKKQPTQMTWLWDVYLIYLHTTSTNFIPTGSEYVIENRFQKNRVAINVLARGKRVNRSC